MNTFEDFYRGKSVLITGHTGFKGSWLALWLNSRGAKVYGYALPAPKSQNNFRLSKVAGCMAGHIEADIRDFGRLKDCVKKTKPDFIFHLAAQSLVRESYHAPRETFEVNVGGTVNLLEVVRVLKRPCTVVVVTSDKCYENTGKAGGYRETDPMGGHDPYSASKGAAEIVVSSYRRSFFDPDDYAIHGVVLSSARSGNVIGGGDWAADRIIPDCVAALAGHEPIMVRNPGAVRPWQHVLEPLSGYLLLAAKMAGKNGNKYCGAWNFGPSARAMHPVRDLVEKMIASWGRGSWRDVSDKNAPHEAACLTLSSRKAQRELGWRNTWDFNRAVAETVAWYKAWHGEAACLKELCLSQIEEFRRDSNQN